MALTISIVLVGAAMAAMLWRLVVVGRARTKARTRSRKPSRYFSIDMTRPVAPTAPGDPET